MKTLKELREKKLTPAEKKKREEIAKAMEKDNPDMPMDKKMAIATATAKRVAEDVEVDEAAPKLKGNSGPYTKQQIEKAAKEAKVDMGAKSRMMMALRNMK